MRRLVVVYDVSELSLAEISNLEVAAIVQAEAEAGDNAHAAVRVRSFVAEDAMVEEIDLTVDRSRRTWPTNDEVRAEGRDPDTGLLR